MSLGLWLSLLAGTPLISVSEAVEKTVALTHTAPESSIDLAVVLDAEPSLRGLEGLLFGLLAHRLESLPGRRTELLLLDARDGGAELRAREGGAEWLLRLRLRSESPRSMTFSSELVRIDRGFWWPEPAPVIAGFAHHRVRIDESLRAWLAPRSRREVGAGLAPPQPWFALDEPVLDLVGCELDPKAAGDELVVLTRTHLRVYRSAEPGPKPWMSRLLSGPSAPARLRAPRGRVSCVAGPTSGSELLFGTSDYAQGVRLRIDGAGAAVVLEERLDGLPLLSLAGQAPELATPDPDSGGFRLTRNGRLVLDLVAPGDRVLALVPPGRFTPLESPTESSETVTLGGLGGSARSELEAGWVTTSSTAWRGPDHLTLRGNDGRAVGRSVPVPGPVRASALLHGPEGELFVVVALGQALESRSTLMRLALASETSSRP